MPERIRNYFLFLQFGFEKWHISPYGNRIYPYAINRFIENFHSLNRVCEIGCGLGDLISKVQGDYLLGLDKDPNVLKAAAFLHRKVKNLLFRSFSFPESPLDGTFDIIVAVNWMHGIDNETVMRVFKRYYDENLNNNGHLIVDSINASGYRYFHDFRKYFSDLKCEIISIGIYSPGREVIAIRKLN